MTKVMDTSFMLPDTNARVVQDGYNAICVCDIRSTKEGTVPKNTCAEIPRYRTLSNFSCSMNASLSSRLSY